MRISEQEISDFGQKLFWLALIIYFAVTLGIAVTKNYQGQRKIANIKNKIISLNQEIESQTLLNVYYQSETFKELEARRRLSLKKPEEKVFILPKREDQEQTQQSQEEKINLQRDKEPNSRKWLRFLLGV